MGGEVEILLSQRSGGQGGPYFDRYAEVIRHCLSWLETNGRTVWPEGGFSYLDIALICMWDHLKYYGTVETAGRDPWIERQTARYASRPSVENSTPTRMEQLQLDLYECQPPPAS